MIKTIKELTEGKNDIFLLVKEVNEKLTKSNSTYVNAVLTDGKDEIQAKDWNNSKNTFGIEPGKVALLTLAGEMYNGALTFKILGLREANAADGVKMSDFIPTAPVEPAELYARCMGFVADINDAEIRGLVKSIYEGRKDEITRSSAAKSVHHNIIGGLLWHSYRMVKASDSMVSTYDNINRDVVIAAVLLHDIGKLYELKTEDSGAADYTVDGTLFGHLYIGAKLVEETGARLGVNPEKVRQLVHIILSHHGKREYGAVALPSTPEAYIVHTLDMLDSRMYMYEKTVADLEPGGTSDAIFNLDGVRVYRPEF